jgi:hypothetical protein
MALLASTAAKAVAAISAASATRNFLNMRELLDGGMAKAAAMDSPGDRTAPPARRLHLNGRYRFGVDAEAADQGCWRSQAA